MDPVRLKSPAKINLTLDILGKDKRAGKHFLNSIFYRVDSFFDDIELKQSDDGSNHLHCDYPGVPKNELNTVIKALDLLDVKGWDIRINKRIPIQGGLAGGSSNAGVLMKYFGEKKGVPSDHLLELAKQVGADVPVFILDDNLSYFEGFGDHMVQSWSIDPLPVEIINTGIKTSTSEAFSGLDLEQCGLDSSKTEALLKLINESQTLNADRLKPYIHNDFESSFFANYPSQKGKGYLCGSGGMMWNLLKF